MKTSALTPELLQRMDANRLHLETHGWSQDVDLRGETPVEVRVPAPATGGVIVLDLATATGFVPIDLDPTLRDRRNLGVWVTPALPAQETR